MREIISRVVFCLILVVLSFAGGYIYKKDLYEKDISTTVKNQIVVQEKIKTVVEKVEVPSVIYREKIVYKYKTIEPKIEQYRENTASDACSELDPEFVQLFNESVKGAVQ